MVSKAEFLATVRHRVSGGLPENPRRPLSPVGDAPIRYTPDLGDVVARFEEAAVQAGAELIPARDGFPDAVERVIAATGATRLVVSGDPECVGIADVADRTGAGIAPLDELAAVAGTELGVTGAVAGVALTGSVVIDSSRTGSRVASLLPDIHLVLLRRDTIVATPGDVLRDPARIVGDPLPSNLVLVTGPSRSADIELRLTVGVHGPRRLLIALR